MVDAESRITAACRLHLESSSDFLYPERCGQEVSLKRCYTSNKQHGLTLHKLLNLVAHATRILIRSAQKARKGYGMGKDW